MTNPIKRVTNSATDALEKHYTATARAGLTINRIGKMHVNGVPKKVISTQLTENSRGGNEYTETDVDTCIMLYEDTQAYVGVTKSQATALIEDQSHHELLIELDQHNSNYNLNG